MTKLDEVIKRKITRPQLEFSTIMLIQELTQELMTRRGDYQIRKLLLELKKFREAANK